MPSPDSRSRAPTPAATPAPLPAAALQLPLFDGAALPADRPARGRTGLPERRYAKLNGRIVCWELRRAPRRTIGFVVDHRGLRISAPRWASLSEIDRAMTEKADWIVRKLDEWREQAARRERLATRWEDGGDIPVLGRPVTLRLDRGGAGVTLGDGELRIGLPAAASADDTRQRVHEWLQQHARSVFAERIALLAQRLGRAPRRWTLSSARTRWGSCTSDGSIRLNWRLVHFPPGIVDYVVAHELAHLVEMNHGPRFWAIVARLCPDFEQARTWLRQQRGEACVR